MERYAKRYINMKASHPEIAKRMPHEALNVILNTLDAYIANHKDVFDVLDKAAYTDLFHGRLSEYEYMKPRCGYYCLEEIEDCIGNCIRQFAIIDFLLQEIANLNETGEREIPYFSNELNKGFERVNFGFRIINNHIAPIIDQDEIQEFDEAVNQVPDNVKQHLDKAMLYLSTNLDYENSIKESISAVEAFCYKYTQEGVLSDSLRVLLKRKILHPRLKAAFEKLYCYSSEKDTGIRHGKGVEHETFMPTYYEAKFMLVSCSAFINYIKGRFSEELEGTE
jgi:hypothetical protein